MKVKRQWDFREVEKLLKANGFKKSGVNSSHVLFKNAEKQLISIPMSLNCMLLRRVFKENNIVVTA